MRTLLVAGFTSPLSAALLEALDPGSFRILGIFRTRRERAEELEQRAQARGIEVAVLAADLASDEGVALLGPLVPPEGADLVFALAPRLELQALARGEARLFHAQFEGQVLPAVGLARLLAPRWQRARSGNAVFVLSATTLGDPPAGFAAYTAAKYALLGLARTLSVEHRAQGVSVAAVSPAAFPSALWDGVPEAVVEGQEHSSPAAVAGEIVQLLGRRPDASGHGAPFVNVPVGVARRGELAVASPERG